MRELMDGRELMYGIVCLAGALGALNLLGVWMATGSVLACMAAPVAVFVSVISFTMAYAHGLGLMGD